MGRGQLATAWAEESAEEEAVAVGSFPEINVDLKQPPPRVALEIAL